MELSDFYPYNSRQTARLPQLRFIIAPRSLDTFCITSISRNEAMIVPYKATHDVLVSTLTTVTVLCLGDHYPGDTDV